jgi:hypothetical protein
MRPSYFMGAGAISRAQFVGSTFQFLTNTSGSVLVSATLELGTIAGLQPGDFVMVFVHGQPGFAYGSMSGSGWQQDNYTWSGGQRTSVYHRRITQAIIDNPPSVSGAHLGTIFIVAYRGIGKAVRQSVTSGGGNAGTLTLPGFTPAPDSIGVLSYLARIVSFPSLDFAPPPSWMTRIVQSGSEFRGAIADALAASDYVAESAITWTNLGTSVTLRVGQVYDLRLNP